MTVVVNWKIYGSAKEASQREFPDNSIYYVSKCIRNRSRVDTIFYISKAFYQHIKNNDIEVVTREMYDDFVRN